MSNKLMQAQDTFLDRINQICSKLGLNSVMAQLYSLLYLSGKTMSLDEIVERLKISKGSVSVNIRALENYGAVRRVWVKGSRKDYYEAEGDIYKVIMERIRSLARDRLIEIDSMLASSSKALDPVNWVSASKEECEDLRIFEERLAQLKKLKDKVQALFDFLNSDLLDDILIKQDNAANKDLPGKVELII